MTKLHFLWGLWEGRSINSAGDTMFATTMHQQEDDNRRRRRKSPLSELGERLAYQLRNAEVRSSEEV